MTGTSSMSNGAAGRRGARYRVSSLYDESGQIASHFLNDEFHSFCDTWEHAMADPHFAGVIDIELRAEKLADAPLESLAELAPTGRVRDFYTTWLGFIDWELEPWTTGGAIHFRPHWARVLMHALVLGDAMGLPDTDLRCLAMAAVFHDSRRSSPYLDTGHGARAAGYYADSCETGAMESLAYDPRTFLTIAWHDRDDGDGLHAIETRVSADTMPGMEARSFTDLLPKGSEADAATILRIFKDADGLDRVRLGEGGLDARYLRTDQALAQIEFAHTLLEASNRLH